MSGIEEILPWAIKNFPFKNYTSKEEWFTDVSSNFIQNNRLPLDEILDNELNKFLGAWTPTRSKSIESTLRIFEANIFTEWTPIELSDSLNVNPSTMRSRLSRLVKKGLLTRIRRGVYTK